MHLSILILILAAGTAPLANAYIGTLYPWTLSGVGSCGTQLNALDLSVALSKVIMDSAVGKGRMHPPHASSISFAHILPFGNPHNIFATSASSPCQAFSVSIPTLCLVS